MSLISTGLSGPTGLPTGLLINPTVPHIRNMDPKLFAIDNVDHFIIEQRNNLLLSMAQAQAQGQMAQACAADLLSPMSLPAALRSFAVAQQAATSSNGNMTTWLDLAAAMRPLHKTGLLSNEPKLSSMPFLTAPPTTDAIVSPQRILAQKTNSNEGALLRSGKKVGFSIADILGSDAGVGATNGSNGIVHASLSTSNAVVGSSLSTNTSLASANTNSEESVDFFKRFKELFDRLDQQDSTTKTQRSQFSEMLLSGSDSESRTQRESAKSAAMSANQTQTEPFNISEEQKTSTTLQGSVQFSLNNPIDSVSSVQSPRFATGHDSGNRIGFPPSSWPAWVYCTRYSDRPSAGPRARRSRRHYSAVDEEKRPRTAFTPEQLKRLKEEFDENHYLTEERRQRLAKELALNESQIKIWFQNRRAKVCTCSEIVTYSLFSYMVEMNHMLKVKKTSGIRNGLAIELMAQGLYNHSGTPDKLGSPVQASNEQQDDENTTSTFSMS